MHLLASMWGGGPTLAPDSVSYNTAIKACANGFQLARAADLFADMVAHGVKPNVTTFNTMASPCFPFPFPFPFPLPFPES